MHWRGDMCLMIHTSQRCSLFILLRDPTSHPHTQGRCVEVRHSSLRSSYFIPSTRRKLIPVNVCRVPYSHILWSGGHILFASQLDVKDLNRNLYTETSLGLGVFLLNRSKLGRNWTYKVVVPRAGRRASISAHDARFEVRGNVGSGGRTPVQSYCGWGQKKS